MRTPAEGARQTQFSGFPTGARATAVPSVFFSEVMPQIDDPDELRVTLYVIYALGRHRGYPRFVTARELEAEAPLLGSLGDGGDDVAIERLRRGLEAAARRGTIIRLDLEGETGVDALYFLNAPSDRRAVDLIRQGRLDIGRPLPAKSGAPASERGNVFQLYEENIGTLTPLVAEELKEAEQLYPMPWLEEAFREAALLNKRSWRYVSRILQRWATEGKRREKAGRDLDAADPRARIIRRFDGLSGGE